MAGKKRSKVNKTKLGVDILNRFRLDNDGDTTYNSRYMNGAIIENVSKGDTVHPSRGRVIGYYANTEGNGARFKVETKEGKTDWDDFRCRIVRLSMSIEVE